MFSGPVKHVFFTGPPGIGKSTLVSRVASTLKERLGCDSVKGFVTEEVRRGGTRQGFDVVTTDSKRFPLSRAFAEGEETTGPKVGKYTVFLEDFNCAVDEIFPEEETRATQTVFALDEVGKMELFSDKFKDKVSTFLETSREVHVIGTVPMAKGGKQIPFVESICGRDDVAVVEVTKDNRNSLVEETVSSLMSLMQK
eukprot:gb/GECG01014379.1/.p1 GENE.gb/GECG01014379.1/~~gb/GECG01014379.1/.p1  ORF type:complete len:197 (+),score=35.73 gb/GECG01014379.1/:1-591(+)